MKYKFTKSLTMAILLSFCVCSVQAQTTPPKNPPASATTVQIPEEFWDFPLLYFADSAAYIYNRLLKKTVTARKLFKQMKFYTEKQLDGTEEKSELVKTELKGNNVIFTVKTTRPGNIFFFDLAIYCDIKNKQNYISSVRINSKNGDDTIYIKPVNYADSYSVAEFKASYEQIYKILVIWYRWDEIDKYYFLD